MKEQESMPKSVILLEDIEARALRYEDSFYMLSPNTKVLHFTESTGLKFENEFPETNTIYIRHPFVRDLYLLQNTDMEKVQIDKMNKFSILCRILGAVKFKVVRILEDKNAIDVGGKGRVRKESGIVNKKVGAKVGADLAGQVKYEGSLDKYSRYQLENVYQQDQNLDFSYAYTEAIKYALENGLLQDEGISSLIEKRNPSLGVNSLLKSERLVVNVSKEINKFLEISLGLNLFAEANLIPLKIGGSINSEYTFEGSVKYLKRESIEFELEIEF